MNYIEISGIGDFSVEKTFDCGQCFRFDSDGNNKNSVSGVAFGRFVRFEQIGDTLRIYNATEQEYDQIWKRFLALDADYSAIREDIFRNISGDTIREAMEYGKGIRILRQDRWEAVCSFIISQNNNIPRIKKIISALCRAYGEKITVGEECYYAFPTPEALYRAGVDELFALKTGFRAKYLHDAAEKMVSGSLDLDRVFELPTEQAIAELCRVKGIGIKVASCAALFGFDKTDAFPVDVWVKRVLEKYFPDGLDIKAAGKYGGIAQQYLFYYERWRSRAD